jgi:hypothetical protein
LSISSSPFSINGGLMGTIPFQVGFLSALSESSVVCFACHDDCYCCAFIALHNA